MTLKMGHGHQNWHEPIKLNGRIIMESRNISHTDSKTPLDVLVFRTFLKRINQCFDHQSTMYMLPSVTINYTKVEINQTKLCTKRATFSLIFQTPL